MTAKVNDNLYIGSITLKYEKNGSRLKLIKEENNINLENQKLLEKITNLKKENEKLQNKKEIKEEVKKEIINDIKSTTIVIPKKDIKTKPEIIKNNQLKEPEIKKEKENK